MGFLPSQEVEREVQYAASQGAKRFAALAPSTPYGQTMAEALNEAVDESRRHAWPRSNIYEPRASGSAPTSVPAARRAKGRRSMRC